MNYCTSLIIKIILLNSTEEDLVNGFSNDITELLNCTDLLTIINKILKGKMIDTKNRRC